MHFPQPVVSIAVEARTSADRERMLEVIARLAREDPTFTYKTDEETQELILSGMGELHLEILQKRMQHEFDVTSRFGRPRVNYRETVAAPGAGIGDFNKRIGDAQVIGRAAVEIQPRPRLPGEHGCQPVEIEMAGRTKDLPASQKAEAAETIAAICTAGGAHGYPVVDVRVRVTEVRLNDCADPLVPLRASLTMALRHALSATGTLLLEPVMNLEVRVPESFLGGVVRDLGARRAVVRETDISETIATIRAFVPLAGMFGYSTDLRSLTQGRGSFSMEPFDYQPAT
jgi:elongation factor G